MIALNRSPGLILSKFSLIQDYFLEVLLYLHFSRGAGVGAGICPCCGAGVFVFRFGAGVTNPPVILPGGGVGDRVLWSRVALGYSTAQWVLVAHDKGTLR